MGKYISCIISIFILGIQLLQAQITQFTGDGKRAWNITTKSGFYQIQITSEGEVLPVHFGPKAQAESIASQGRSRGNGPFHLHEVPVRGGMADKIPAVELIFPDKTRDVELVFVNAELNTVNGRQTLSIIQKDRHYPLTITSFYRVLPEYDIIEKWLVVKNTGKKGAIMLENLQSSSILLPPDQYYLTHHGGRWFNEFQLQQTKITSGIKTLQSRDFSSFQNTPWFLVSSEPRAGKHDSPVWFGNIHYSGNWKIDLESTITGHLQIVGGINFWDTEWKLNAGQSFHTPIMSIGYTALGAEEAARLSAAYITGEIMRPEMRDKIRPVLYNSWYATGFNVSEESQLKLAKEAKELGVELFVIDDGWFTGRKDDRAGLGDWVADPDKFPAGLNPLIKQVNEMGMEFGLWVEPEMVNPNSQLYKSHPDWVMHFPNRTRNEWRHQLTLNLAREDVFNYLYEALSNLLSKHNIKYLKWDRNRGLSEPGWPSAASAAQREIRIRYVNNLNRLIDTLQKKFPDVLFESCASGGGRPDLGMLSRMDQTWTSDNTNPLDRLFIQFGYLSAYPAGSMVCWTTEYDRKSINLPLDFIFDVAMQGVLGVGDNILKWNAAHKATAKRKIEEYKRIRPIIQKGKLYRIYSPLEGNRIALQYISQDEREIVALLYNLQNIPDGTQMNNQQQKMLLFQGLDPSAQYQIINQEATVYTGAFLMDIGIPWPIKADFRSQVTRFKKL